MLGTDGAWGDFIDSTKDKAKWKEEMEQSILLKNNSSCLFVFLSKTLVGR